MADEPQWEAAETPAWAQPSGWQPAEAPPWAADVTPATAGGPARITVRPGAQPEPPPPTESEPSWGDIATDVGLSTAIGIPKGVIGMAGLPEQLANWGAQGLSYLTGREPETFRDQGAMRLPSTQQIRSKVENVTGQLYEPKTTYGEYGQSVGEMLPAALAGPGGLVPRVIGQAVIPGILSEAAGQTARSVFPPAEPYVRGATALAAGMRGVGKAERAAAEASRRQLLDVEMPAGANMLYDKVREQTVGVPIPLQNRMVAGQQFRNELDQAGIRDIGDGALAHKYANSIMKGSKDVNDLVQWRQTVRDDLFGKGKIEARAANVLSNAIDKTIDSIVPGAAADLRAANRELALQKLGQHLDERFQTVEQATAAAASGMNLDNKIRQALLQFKKNQQDWHSLTPHEQLKVDSIIQGGVPRNALRFISNASGGGGGLGSMAMAYIGHVVFGKVGAVAGTIIPRAIKHLQNATSQADANALLAGVLSRSQFAPTSAADRLLATPNWHRVGRNLYYGSIAGQQQ